MRLVSIETGHGLNDPPQVLLDVPDDWDLKKRYLEWHRWSRTGGQIKFDDRSDIVDIPPQTFAEYLKMHGAKESKDIERYPPR